jgi:GT2 family glycosyltransferase
MEISHSYQAGLISIIIPIRFRADLLKVCLDSIKAYTPEKYELILVLDGVEGNEFDFVRNNGALVLENKGTALGFPKTVNKGILQAKGEYIMILNSDIVATPNWMTEMMKAFKLDPLIGLVAPTFSETGGVQNIDYNKKGVDYTWVDEVKGVCMFFKRSALAKIGLLDEQFKMGGGEDNDICMRNKLAGFKAIVARKSFIYHYNSASFRELFDNDVLRSRKYASSVFSMFKRKWKDELNHKPRIFIAIPNNGWIHTELMIRLIEWTHDPELSIHLKAPIGLVPHDNARNTCVKEFLEDYYDYLLFIDNDIVPPPNALRELLNADKDIIAPLCLTWKDDDNGLGFPMPVALRYNEEGLYKPYYGKGIEETDAITGGMFLVKREVYEKMDRPFAFTYHTNGTVIYSEDFYFCQQAQKLGYKLYTHYELICKHYKNIDIKEVSDLMYHYAKK